MDDYEEFDYSGSPGETYTIVEDRVETGGGRARGGYSFSRRELRDIAISMVVLAAAFMILYRDDAIMSYLSYHLGDTLSWVALFCVCFVLVFLSFLLHELGHKFAAQGFGMWSEFRMFPMGLLLTLVSSAFGFLFAAPGAVVIQGRATKEENGKIGIAGPVVNIVLAAVGIAGCLLTNYSAAVLFFSMFAYLNAFLAVFNLLPIPPLDGSKIWKWSVPVYIFAFAVAVLELAYLFLWMPDLYFRY